MNSKQLYALTTQNIMFTDEQTIPVIVRTNTAGVHFGYIRHRANKSEVMLSNSRRIYYWQGAWTLSEIADTGVTIKGSKIATVVSILLTEAIEIIPCTPAAEKNLNEAVWTK